MKNEIKSTAHSKYRCEYHIVFAPKYRRKEIYGQLKRDIGEILRKLCEQKRCRNHRGRSLPRSYPHACKCSTIFKYSTVYGIFKRQEQFNDIRQTCELKIQIRTKKFLVQRIFCGYSRKEQNCDKAVHKKSVGRRLYKRPNKSKRIY